MLGFNSAWIPNSTLKKILRTRKNPIVIDVGCNIGDFSESIVRQNNTSIIYAFDLHEGLTSILNKKFTNFQFYFKAIALSDRRGISGINLNKTNDRKAYLSDTKNLKRIKVDTLDGSLRKLRLTKIIILKIDTEGNDFKVLKGAIDTLKITEIIIFEIMYKLLQNAADPNTVINYLRDHGFKYFYRSTKFFGLVPISKIQPWEVATQNIVACKNEIDKYKTRWYSVNNWLGSSVGMSERLKIVRSPVRSRPKPL